MAPPCCSKAARLAELATMMDLMEQAQLALIEQRPAGPTGAALREELGTIRGLQARFAADARRCCGLPPDAAREHALAWRW